MASTLRLSELSTDPTQLAMADVDSSQMLQLMQASPWGQALLEAARSQKGIAKVKFAAVQKSSFRT
eukprot:3221065-Amphidinium_carterae.1